MDQGIRDILLIAGILGCAGYVFYLLVIKGMLDTAAEKEHTLSESEDDVAKMIGAIIMGLLLAVVLILTSR